MINYRFAETNDINLLVCLRLKFLEVSPSDKNYQELKNNIENYFKNKMLSGECTIVLAENELAVIGTGVIFYYDSVPSVSNIEGRNAYVTSMYVDEKFRRQKVGSTILKKLLEKAEEKNYKNIMLNATELGKKLYEKYGFIDIENGMIYKY